MDHPLERELTEHGRSLRQLACALVGAADADDVVQDAALAALEQRPRGGSLGGWLATVVRRLAHKQRRGALRRLKREQTVAQPESATPLDHLELRDTYAQLNGAVMALPEPYQSMILERFVGGRTPSEIAAEHDIPVRTVKTRLQRGIAMLRADLDHRRGDWRQALAVAFGLEHLLPTTGVAAVAGITVMSITNKLWLGGAAAVAVLAGMWASAGALFSTPERDTTASSPIGVAAAELAEGKKESPRAPAPQAAVGDRRVEVPAQAIATATLRGRCVDESGAPLAGVRASLDGFEAIGERTETWVRDHGPVERLFRKLTTAADGRFEFTFTPLPPLEYSIALGDDRHAEMNARWSSIDAARTIELGDVTMRPGVKFRGTLRHDDDTPVANRDLHFWNAAWTAPSGDVPSPRLDVAARTDANGVFETYWRAVAGSYRIQVAGHLKVTPDLASADGSRVVDELQLTVPAPRYRTPIRGIVVDERGAPVADTVVTSVAGSDLEPRAYAVTRRDGTFLLERPDQLALDAVTLTASAKGFEAATTDEQHRWGASEVRIALRRGVAVEFVAHDGTDQQPVLDYRLRLVTRGSHSFGDADVRARGHHPDGRVVVEGLTRGDYIAVVEPADASLCAKELAITVVDPSPVRIDIVVPRAQQRRVHVHLPDGTPAVGTELRLVDPRGHTVTADMTIEPLVTALAVPSAAELQQTTTDDNGDAVLRGPADRPLAVLLSSGQHAPLAIAAVQLGDPATLDVEVDAGGRLRLRAGPAAALADIRRAARLDNAAASASDAASHTPYFRLVRGGSATGAGASIFPPPQSGRRLVLDPDGQLACDGVPVGSWDLEFQSFRSMPSPFGRGVAFQGQRQRVGTVEIRAAGTTSVDVDLSSFLEGELDAVVLHNGAPLPDYEVTLHADHGGDATPTMANVRTDAAGRLRLSLRAGTYRLSAAAPNQLLERIRAADVVTVAVGTTNATFQFTTAILQLRVLDADGRPAAGAVVVLHRDGELRRTLPPADSNGRVQALVETETFVAGTMPRRLLDPAALRAAVGAPLRGTDPLASLRLMVGTITVTTRGAEQELRLPAAWSQ